MNKLEENLNEKEYEDLIKEDKELYGIEEDDDFGYNKERNITVKKVEIKLHYYINIKEEEFNFENILILNSNQTVEDIIIWGINSFNNSKYRINLDGKDYELKYLNNSIDDFKCYEIRICKKKNFKPKYDMPPFVRENYIRNIINERICLTCNNNNLLLCQKVIDDNDRNSKIDDLIDEKLDEGGSLKKCLIY